MTRAAAGRPALAIAFDRIRIFSGPSPIPWAEPTNQDLLRAMHRDIHATIDAAACRSLYRPGARIPHCTLATRVRPDRAAQALAFAQAFRGGVEVVFDMVDCLAFPPLARAGEARLGAPSQGGSSSLTTSELFSGSHGRRLLVAIQGGPRPAPRYLYLYLYLCPRPRRNASNARSVALDT